MVKKLTVDYRDLIKARPTTRVQSINNLADEYSKRLTPSELAAKFPKLETPAKAARSSGQSISDAQSGYDYNKASEYSSSPSIPYDPNAQATYRPQSPSKNVPPTPKLAPKPTTSNRQYNKGGAIQTVPKNVDPATIDMTPSNHQTYQSQYKPLTSSTTTTPSDKPPTKPTTSKGDDPNKLTGNRIDRSKFAAELKDPETIKLIARRLDNEVGSQGDDAKRAWLETMYNRADSRGLSLKQAVTGKYYPTRYPHKSYKESDYALIEDVVTSGSNITNGATGNASGSVGFGKKGYETYKAGGERFGREENDINWKPRFLDNPVDNVKQQYSDNGAIIQGTKPPQSPTEIKPNPSAPAPGIAANGQKTYDISNYKGDNSNRVSGVNKFLVESMQEGAKNAFGDPNDPRTRYVLDFQNGIRSDPSSKHGSGNAVDVQIFDRETGQYVRGPKEWNGVESRGRGGEQIMRDAFANPHTFRIYEALGQGAYKAALEKHGKKAADTISAGVYFSSSKQARGVPSPDNMHFSINEGQRTGKLPTGLSPNAKYRTGEKAVDWLAKHGAAPSRGMGDDPLNWKSEFHPDYNPTTDVAEPVTTTQPPPSEQTQNNEIKKEEQSKPVPLKDRGIVSASGHKKTEEDLADEKEQQKELEELSKTTAPSVQSTPATAATASMPSPTENKATGGDGAGNLIPDQTAPGLSKETGNQEGISPLVPMTKEPGQGFEGGTQQALDAEKRLKADNYSSAPAAKAPGPTPAPSPTPAPAPKASPAPMPKPTPAPSPKMASGGSVRGTGEELSMIDNRSGRKLGEVSRGENIRFDHSGKALVTPDRRVDPRNLEQQREMRQAKQEHAADQKSMEQNVSQNIMQQMKPNGVPNSNFAGHEQWGAQPTNPSYVRAMQQAKGRKSEGVYAGSRFGEDQNSAIS